MLVKLTIFILLSMVSHAFLKNCQSFNPNNQNECIACRKTYYVSNGGCVICPTGQINIKQCIDIQNNGNNRQTGTISLPQSQAIPPSENKAESILSNLFLSPKTSTTITTTPTTSTEAKPVENKIPEQKPITQAIIPSTPPPPTPSGQKKDQAIDLSSLIFSYLPIKCIQFKVVPTILCSACEKGYQLTSNNLCQEVKAESTDKSLGNLAVTLVQASPPSEPQATNPSPPSSQQTSSSPSLPPAPAPVTSNQVSIQAPAITTQQNSDISSSLSPDSSPKSANTAPVSSTPQTVPVTPSSTTPLKAIPQAQIPIISTSQQDKDVLSVFIPIIPIVSTKPKETTPSPLPQVKATTSQTAQNPSQDKIFGVLPKHQQIYDSNCVKYNINFSIFKFISPQNQRCLLCYNGFFYDLQKQQCQPFNPLCKTVDPQNSCLGCYLGYDLLNGKCLISQGKYPISKTSSNTPSNSQTDPNCKQYKTDNSDCIQCSSRYYYDPSKRLCVQVDGSCKTWNETNGYCITCYSGYLCGTTDRVCKPIQSIVTDKSNPYDPVTLKKFCLKFVNNNCISCVTRSILMNGVCMPVSDLCMTFDRRFGFCLSCYPGYELNEGMCETPILNPDPNCGKRTKNGCEYCNPNYFLNQNGICEVVSNLCIGYNQSNGHCLDCLPFYTLQKQSGECIYVV